MQDKYSGEMINIDPDMIDKLKTSTQDTPDVQEMLHQTPFDPTAIAQKMESSGYCVLQTNEIVSLKEKTFKVTRFDKKSIVLIPTNCVEKVSEMGFKTGEKFHLKNGNFMVQSFGSGALILKGIAGTHNFDGKVIEDYRKKQLKEVLKAEKKAENPPKE